MNEVTAESRVEKYEGFAGFSAGDAMDRFEFLGWRAGRRRNSKLGLC